VIPLALPARAARSSGSKTIRPRRSPGWLVTRNVGEDGIAELEARATGRRAGDLAAAMQAAIRDWEQQGKDLPVNAIS
jgi:hypothetical protein